MDSVNIAAIPPVAALTVAAVDYKGTITLGSVVVFLSTVFAAAWFNFRRKAGDDRTDRAIRAAQDAAEIAQKAADAWQSECIAKDRKLERIEDDLISERGRCNDALAEVAKLTERTDVTKFAQDISRQNEAILSELRALTTAVTALATIPAQK